ncbi:MAG: M23 family metallopeptidase [Ruminococcaceae bacterium]|nr:M23 family metallopeptidase [Oscillospiraceae bacterium]
MKNKFIFAILALLCLIPSGVAYASYHRIQSAPVDVSNAESISIDDPAGNNYSFVKEKDGDEADDLIRYFLNLKENGQSITALPDSLLGEQFFKVTVSAAVKSVTYECYFATDPTTCYFVAPDGTTYKISDQDAEAFITTRYAECIYKAAALPTLTLAGTVDVTPDTASWLYKNYTGGYVESDVSSFVYPSVESYEVEGSLGLAFDMIPDFCSVKVTNASGDTLYDGMLDSIAELSLRNVPQIFVEVSAKWYQDATRSFYGDLLYSFSSYVKAPAEFWLGMTTVNAGRFVAITATNVTGPEGITLSSTTLPNADTPVFYDAGNSMAVALLGIDIETPAGVYDLAFTYGNTTSHVALNVTDPNGGAGIPYSFVYVDESVVQQTRSSAALMQYETVEKELLGSSSATRYFYDFFLDGMAGECTLQRGFGRDIYLNDSTTPVYRTNGVDYSAPAGTQVMACNAGVVVYAGWLEYAGNLIVVDHGWGLKTWYYNLGSVDVSVGDWVDKGQGMGTVGMTGFTSVNGAHIAMSVGPRFVCPYDTWPDSQYAGKVIIARIDE